MALYSRREAETFGRALVMPNVKPPIADGDSLSSYREAIKTATAKFPDFEPLMSFKLLPGMTAATVGICAAGGAVAAKYYPIGITTNASDGVSDPDEAAEALSAIEEAGLVLCIHGEAPGFPVLEREAAFLPVLDRILKRWPRLRVVLEHVSTREAVRFVETGPERLAATITAHHLLFTIDDLAGEALDPHLFCKPLLKSAADRDDLRRVVLERNPRFFFGSDTAPHQKAAKESGAAPGGVYAAPVAVCALAELFENLGDIDALKPFLSGSGAAFYGLPAPRGWLTLEKSARAVPGTVDEVVPMCAGRRLAWRVAARQPGPATA